MNIKVKRKRERKRLEQNKEENKAEKNMNDFVTRQNRQVHKIRKSN